MAYSYCQCSVADLEPRVFHIASVSRKKIKISFTETAVVNTRKDPVKYMCIR